MDILTHVVVFVIFTIANLSFLIWGIRKQYRIEKEELKSLGEFANSIEIRFIDVFFEFTCKYKGLPFLLIIINDLWVGVILAMLYKNGFIGPF